MLNIPEMRKLIQTEIASAWIAGSGAAVEEARR
jgi:hypothetical protein